MYTARVFWRHGCSLCFLLEEPLDYCHHEVDAFWSEDLWVSEGIWAGAWEGDYEEEYLGHWRQWGDLPWIYEGKRVYLRMV